MQTADPGAQTPPHKAESHSSEASPLSALGGLTKQGPQSLNGYLITVGDHSPLPNLSTRLRTHLIPADVNGIFQEAKLAEYLADLVIDYCIPRRRQAEASEELLRTGSFESINALRREAVEMFVDSEKSGEAGELLLYLLTERVLGAPQILSKMSLKTSSMMHYHGADGIHAKRTETGLALYWGESKIHEDRASAVRECLNSVAPFLSDANRQTATRDLGLVRDNLDVEGKDLKDAMVRFFIKRNPEWNRLEFRAACLVGFNLDSYPKFVDLDDIRSDAKVYEEIQVWAEHLDTHVRKHKLDRIEIDFFMVPFNNISTFRELVLTALGVK